MHDMCGLGLAPDNRKPAAHINVLLGVEGRQVAFDAEEHIDVCRSLALVGCQS